MLESVLSKQEWLVGNKATAADFVFLTYVPRTLGTTPVQALMMSYRWNDGAANFILENFDFEKEFPATAK